MITLITKPLPNAIAVGIILTAASLSPFNHAQTFAKTPDVQVKGSTVNCSRVNTKVRSPDVGVSVPNPGKLVPNVGKILRKGLGVPAPDSNAPHVGAPKVSAKTPSANCPPPKKSSSSH
jgi:hypothetical protein